MKNKESMIVSKGETIVERIMTGVLTALIIAMIFALFTLFNTVSSLKAFADKGERFTKEEFNTYNAEVKETMATVKNDVRTNREAIIRVEAEQKYQTELLQQVLQKLK